MTNPVRIIPVSSPELSGLYNIYRSTHNGDYGLHGHQAVEVSFVLGGSCAMVIEGKTINAQPGDIFIVYPGMAHKLLNRNEFDEVILSFAANAFFQYVPELASLPGADHLFIPEKRKKNDLPWVRLSSGDYTEARKLVLKMFNEFKRKQIGWLPLVRSYFVNLMMLMLRSHSGGSFADMRIRQGLNNSVEYMEKHYSDTIRLEDLANIAGLSRSQYIRIFRKLYTATPFDYLINIRIDCAQNMLLTTNRSITDIAFTCGFNDSSYFSRQFRKRTGISPNEFRKPWSL